MLRSPSHESFTTDNSLFSISTLALDISGCAGGNGKNSRGTLTFRELRGSSPHPDFAIDPMTKRYVRPDENIAEYRSSSCIVCHARPFDIIPEGVWFEESNDLIRSCAALSATLGIQKSFSTSDITQLPGPPDSLHADRGHNQQQHHHQHHNLSHHGSHGLGHQQHQHATSELALNSLQRCGYMLDNPRLDHASRSCSTWVAVGELASASQLPSPHGGPANVVHAAAGSGVGLSLPAGSTPPPPAAAPAFTAADLIRSVNKKVRQNYIRRRLLTTYRALERLSQSEFNLDRLEAEAAAATELLGPGPTELQVPQQPQQQQSQPPPASTPSTTIAEEHNVAGVSVTAAAAAAATTGAGPVSLEALQVKAARMSLEAASIKQKIISITHNNSLMTIDDIEKERGKPLSKYDRNMMIFNWLHSLDEVTGGDAGEELETVATAAPSQAPPPKSDNAD